MLKLSPVSFRKIRERSRKPNSLQQPLDNVPPLGKRRSRQDEHELFTTDPAETIDPADDGMGDADKIAQHRVTALMTETIIDLLEKIDIERAKAKRGLQPL